MTWSTPITWTNAVLTAAQLNAQIRDNMNETAVAKATTAGRYYVSGGVNSLTERFLASGLDDTILNTVTTTYGGTTPSVTLTTGPSSLVFIYCSLSIDTNSQYALMSFEVSGAGTLAPADNRSIGTARFTVSTTILVSGVFLVTHTAGSNTFMNRYKVTGGTGTYDHRRIIVMSQ